VTPQTRPTRSSPRHDDAAVEAYRDCLRSKKRDPELLKAARDGRGVVYPRTGTPQGASAKLC
jgi:hypothetical protein